MKFLLPIGTLLISLISFGEAAPVLSALDAKVIALPSTKSEDQVKKVVLTVALEQARRLQEAGKTEEAASLTADVDSALGTPSDVMCRASADIRHISALNEVRTKVGNPNIQWISDGLGEELKQPDPFLKPGAYAENSLGDKPTSTNGGLANTIDALFWTYVNPASPFRHNPEVLARFLRRALFFMEGLEPLADQVLSTKKGYLDEFALGPVSAPLREVAQLFPQMLLPTQRRLWDRVLRKAADAQLQDFGRFKGTYPNIDIARGYQLLNFGLYLNDANLLTKANEIVFIQTQNVYPDSGVAYINKQNAQQGYQYTVAIYLARFYEVGKDPRILEMLKSMEWYGPLNGKSGEWWTASNWKAMWNSTGSDYGGEFVTAVTGNPYLVGMRGEYKPVLKKWKDARASVAWYRDDITPEKLPENYTCIDRNIQGPRAWYGDFTYAATLRDIPLDEAGHGTVMGCMLAYQSVIPRMAPMVQIKDKGGNPLWTWITSGLKGTSTVGRHFSVTSATYQPTSFCSSSKGVVAPEWVANQLWLGLPDRVIGLMRIAPSSDRAGAFNVASQLQLGVGGPKVQIPSSKPGHYEFGAFEVISHANNYTDIVFQPQTMRNDKSFATEMVWRSAKPAPGDKPFFHSDGRHPMRGMPVGEWKTYLKNRPFFNIVEVKLRTSSDEARVKHLPHPELIGFAVSVGPKTYTLWMNSLEKPIPINLKSSTETSLFLSGTPTSSPLKPIPATATLEPHQHLVLVSSSDPVDHLPGWPTFQEMLGNITH